MTCQPARLAIIGGTGLSQLFGDESTVQIVDTPYGAPSAPISLNSADAHPAAFLPRHGHPHNIPPHKINYRANIWALKHIGIERIIAVNAVGGIRPEFAAGVVVVPSQIIDYSYGREHTYSDGKPDAALDHIDFTAPFDRELRTRLLTAAGEQQTTVFDGGVYGVTQGPRLETAAEINRMAADGCDLVGMTAMPEAALARELGIAYASLCLVVNPAAGRSDEVITMEAIQRVLDDGMVAVRSVLSAVIAMV